MVEKYRSLLSFLWWENGCHDILPQSYHMNKLVFSETPSLNCSKYTGQEKLGAWSGCAPTVHLNCHLGEQKNVYLVYLLHHKSYNQQYEKKKIKMQE